MKILLFLLLSTVAAFAQVPSFKSFNPTQFATNNFIVSITNGVLVTNININSSSFTFNGTVISNITQTAGGGDSLWNDIASIATLTNTMEGAEISHNVANGDDDDVYFDLYATTDGSFTNFADIFMIANTNSVQISMTTDAGGVNTSSLILNSGDGSGFIQLQTNGTNEFYVANGSGYTGAGTLFLSDDGTYKAAGGSGSSPFTNVAGIVQYSPGQAVTNELRVVSGSANAATNVAFRVNTENLWSNGEAKLLAVANANTNQFVVLRDGRIIINEPAVTTWIGGAPTANGGSLISLRDIALGDSNNNSVFIGVHESAGNYSYGQMITTLDSSLIEASTFDDNTLVTTTGNIVTGPSSVFLKLFMGPTAQTILEPTVTSSGSAKAYTLDTSNTLTNGDSIISAKNVGSVRFEVDHSGGIQVGPNTRTQWGGTANGAALVSIRDINAGDQDYNELKLGVVDSSGPRDSNFDPYIDIENAGWAARVTDAASGFWVASVNVSSNAVSFVGSGAGQNLWAFDPALSGVLGTNVAYSFDTLNVITNGDTFASFRNQGTELLGIAPEPGGQAQIRWGGTTNVLFRSGTDLVYTNAGGVAGTTYFQTKNLVGTAFFGISSAANAQVTAELTRNVVLAPNAASMSYVFSTGGVVPTSNGVADIGSTENQFNDLYLDDTIIWNGSTNSLFDTWQPTSPENVITARPGTLVRDTGNGVLYVKTSGTSNLGFQPVHVGNQAYLAANATVSDATLVNLSLSAGVIAGKKYAFTCILFVNNSVAADGVKIDFDGGSATATNFRAHTKITDAALLTSTQTSALATDITAATVTGDAEIEINGSFEPSASGTFIPRFACNADTTGTLTVYRGSNLIFTEIP